MPRTTYRTSSQHKHGIFGLQNQLARWLQLKCHRTDGQKKNDSAKQNSESWQSSEKAGLDVEMLRIIDTQIFRGLPCTMRTTYVCES